MKTTKDKRIFKSEVPSSFNQAATSNQSICPLHKIRSNHTLANCREFQKLNVGNRLDIIKENKLCFRCFGKHPAKDCNSTESCRECKSERHHYLLHSNRRTPDATAGTGNYRNAGAPSDTSPVSAVTSLAAACTKLCGRNQPPHLRCKSAVVTISALNNKKNCIQGLAIIEEQYNSTLAAPEVFQQLGLDTINVEYTLTTLTAAKTPHTGRLTKKLLVKGTSNYTFELNNITECNKLLDASKELGTQQDSADWQHLEDDSTISNTRTRPKAQNTPFN